MQLRTAAVGPFYLADEETNLPAVGGRLAKAAAVTRRQVDQDAGSRWRRGSIG